MSISLQKQENSDEHFSSEKMRMSNPLHRMRRERWVGLLIFNGFLLAAALIQVLGGAPLKIDLGISGESSFIQTEELQ